MRDHLTKRVEPTSRCNGWKKDGTQCSRVPKTGFSVCHWHGAASPSIRAAGVERAIEGRRRQALQVRMSTGEIRLGFDSAADELEKVIAQTIALKDVASEAFGKLEGQLRYEHHAGEQLRAEVAFFERMLEKTSKSLIDYQKLGLDERRVRIDELKVGLILGAMQRILDRLELSDEQKELAVEIVPEELRALSGRQ